MSSAAHLTEGPALRSGTALGRGADCATVQVYMHACICRSGIWSALYSSRGPVGCCVASYRSHFLTETPNAWAGTPLTFDLWRSAIYIVNVTVITI